MMRNNLSTEKIFRVRKWKNGSPFVFEANNSSQVWDRLRGIQFRNLTLRKIIELKVTINHQSPCAIVINRNANQEQNTGF